MHLLSFIFYILKWSRPPQLSTLYPYTTLFRSARALKNEWTDKILELEKEYGDYESLKDYISGEANKRYIHDGHFNEGLDRKSTRLNSSHVAISYAVFCLKKKNTNKSSRMRDS